MGEDTKLNTNRKRMSQIILQMNNENVKVKITQLGPTVCNPMDYTVHGILLARILEWVASSLLQRILPTQGSNPCLLHCRQILYQLSDQGSKCSSYTGLTCSVGLGSRRGTPDIAGMCEECLW